MSIQTVSWTSWIIVWMFGAEKVIFYPSPADPWLELCMKIQGKASESILAFHLPLTRLLQTAASFGLTVTT